MSQRHTIKQKTFFEIWTIRQTKKFEKKYRNDKK